MHNSLTRISIVGFLIMILGILMPGCRKAVSPAQDAGAFEGNQTKASDIAERQSMQWVDSVMDGMTLEQMAGQLIMPAVFSDDSRNALRQVAAYVADSHIGGVVLLKGTPEAAYAIADTLAGLSCAPPMIAIDAEWGLAMRLKDTPFFPKNGNISPAVRDSILYEYGWEVARECRGLGINMVLGPVLDVLPGDNSKNSFIGVRSFGNDPARVARFGVAYARGLEDGGVLSVAKHFPGHGAADADSHKSLPVVAKDLRELWKKDLLPFERYISEGLSAVMVAHLYVPALDKEEIPVSVSEKILKTMLRNEMKFKGLIITDAMNMAGADGKTGADAIMAGADIVLAPSDTRREVLLLVEAVKSGRFPLAELRDRVRRVLAHKYAVWKKPLENGEDKSIMVRSALEK